MWRWDSVVPEEDTNEPIKGLGQVQGLRGGWGAAGSGSCDSCHPLGQAAGSQPEGTAGAPRLPLQVPGQAQPWNCLLVAKLWECSGASLADLVMPVE